MENNKNYEIKYRNSPQIEGSMDQSLDFDDEPKNLNNNNNVINNTLNTLNNGDTPEYDDSNHGDEQESSITPNYEMQNIFKNLESIQMDEEKEDESLEYLNECLYKHIKKIPLTLNDRKRIVEMHLSDQKKYSIHRLAKLTGLQRKTIKIWKMNYDSICEQ